MCEHNKFIIMCATENMISDFRGYTCRLLLHDHPLSILPLRISPQQLTEACSYKQCQEYIFPLHICTM